MNRKEQKKKYYESHKEELLQKAKERYAAKKLAADPLYTKEYKGQTLEEILTNRKEKNRLQYLKRAAKKLSQSESSSPAPESTT